MYGIELKLKRATRVIRKKGNPLYTTDQIQGLVVIKRDGNIVEVTSACDASSLVRQLARRFGPRELTWTEADRIINQLI